MNKPIFVAVGIIGVLGVILMVTGFDRDNLFDLWLGFAAFLMACLYLIEAWSRSHLT